jgi:hypothetical protein
MREALIAERALLAAARNSLRARVLTADPRELVDPDAGHSLWWHELVGTPLLNEARAGLPRVHGQQSPLSLPPFLVGWASPDEYRHAQPRLPRYF